MTLDGPTSTEQRRQPRVSCTLSVQVHAPAEDVLLFTYATNLSSTGLFVRANRPLPVGTRVNLELQPQSMSERLSLEGLVVRAADAAAAGPRGMGLSFEARSLDDQRLLRRLLQRFEFTPPAVPGYAARS